MADKPVTREEKYLAYLTGDYTGEIPKPITRKEKYLYELCLKGMGGEISPEEIKNAVNEYLEKNQVKPGATTEQAQQIEQNKKDVNSLKNEIDNLIYIRYSEQDGYLTYLGTYANKTLHSKSTYLLKTEPNMTYKYKGIGEYSAMSVLFYDSGKNIIGHGQYWSKYEYTDITTPENTAYVMFSSYAAKEDEVVLSVIPPKELVKPIDIIKSDVDIIKSDVGVIKSDVGVIWKNNGNLVNPSKCVNGYIYDGKIVVNDGYRTSDYIPLFGTNYVKHVNTGGLGEAKSHLALYDYETLVYVKTLTGTDLGDDWYSYTVEEPKKYYARLTNSSSSTEFYFGEGESKLDVAPKYGFKLGEYASVDYSQIKNAPITQEYDYKSMLTGKVWYAIGDSATEGDFSSVTQEPLQSGMYKGEKPVYPFYIGNRTGMIVHNIAKRGAVITTITDQPSRMQWSVDGNYDGLVGDDADYITIWLGANDMWQHVPIGTIDSTDETTFYGAWNKLLAYYCTNYPNTKIGIVASFWCSQEYAEPVIAIGKKYGVPVLNLYNDSNMPVTVGSKRPDVSNEIKTLRNNQWIVSSTNSHPSAKYHEIESYFIEEWLKTL